MRRAVLLVPFVLLLVVPATEAGERARVELSVKGNAVVVHSIRTTLTCYGKRYPGLKARGPWRGQVDARGRIVLHVPHRMRITGRVVRRKDGSVRVAPKHFRFKRGQCDTGKRRWKATLVR